MSTPLPSPLLTAPYVSVPEFKASPTWLGLDDLIEGGTDAQQDAELYNQLLKASAWADMFVRQPLRAHYQVEQKTCRVDTKGNIWIHPAHAPIRQISAISWSTDIQGDWQSVSTVGSSCWIEDARGTIVALSGFNGGWARGLQFGRTPTMATQVYVQVEYIAGYGHGVLAATSSVGTSSFSVDSALGFQGPLTSIAGNMFGASAARIWDPAQEEALTVASTSGNTITSMQAAQYSHAPGVNVSELPAEVKQAVVQYAAGLLLREDVTNDMPWAGSQGPSARRSESKGRAGGLINEAECSLRPYRRER